MRVKTILQFSFVLAVFIGACACQGPKPTPVDTVTPAGSAHGKSAKHDNSMADAPTAPGAR